METIRRAVIDVGTNSVKLLVADVCGREVRPILEESKQTRLGQGFYETRRLQPEAVAATAKATAAFAATARERKAACIRVIATSAAREAVNALELTSAIEQAAGLKVEVIAGEQEAEMGFRGVTTDPQLSQAPLLLLDVGGGSTQMILGQGQTISFCRSFPLGTVRLMESAPCSDPPRPEELQVCQQGLREYLEREVGRNLRQEREVRGQTSEIRGQQPVPSVCPAFSEAVRLVGVGGTASILGCMEAKLESFDRARLEATRLTDARVSWHLQRLWSLPLTERKNITGLPRNRADVILMGVAIYQAVMEQLGFRELRISTRGLRFAACAPEEVGWGSKSHR